MENNHPNHPVDFDDLLPERTNDRTDEEPQVVFPSPYRLDSDQEKHLLEHAFERFEAMEKELGRDQTAAGDWWASGSRDTVNDGAKSFLGRRQCFELVYENDVEWRAATKGGIYEESNWIVPIARRVVTQQIARANASFFGSDPWFAVDLDGAADDELQDAAQRWLRHRFQDAGVKSVLESAVERAFVRGEAVVKFGYRRASDIFEAEMEVLVAADGQPVLDGTGDYVTRDRPVVEIEINPDLGPVEQPGAIPEPPARVLALADDPDIRIPDGHRWEKKIVSRRTTVADGPVAELPYFRDVLIPLTAKDIQSADCMVHLYDVAIADLADQWRREATGLGEGEEARNIDTKRAVEAIRGMEGGGDASSDDSLRAHTLRRAERPEDRTVEDGSAYAGRPAEAHAQIAEFWLKFDANGDGILENIVLVADRQTRRPIYYDYVANVTPDGKRPFGVVRINPVDGRWYGVGSMQVYEQIQNIADLQVNRWNVSNGSSGRATFMRREAVVGHETDPDFEINFGELYELNDGYSADDALSYVSLPEVKSDDLKKLLDFYLQMALNMSGVQHANDAQMAGLQSAKLATSIINIDRAGHEMFGQLLSHLEAGLAPVADAVAEVTLVNMAEKEPYRWLEDDRPHYGELARRLLAPHRLRVRMLLTRYRAEQQKESLAAVIDRTERFYERPPEIQARVAPLYRQYLRAHGIQHADTIIEPFDMGGMGPPGGEPTMDPTSDPRGAPPSAPAESHYANAMGGIAGGLAAVERRAG